MITAIVTAMTDAERSFLPEALEPILDEPLVTQILLCVSEDNDWVEPHPQIDILRLPMMPVGAVRNRAVEAATNEWIAICDGDDVWVRGACRLLLDGAQAQGAYIVGACHYLMDETGVIRACGFARRQPTTGTWLVKREVFQKFPFDETLRARADTIWWNETKHLKQVRVPARLLKYRIRANSASSGNAMKERLARLVRLGQIPVLGRIVYLATWCRWAMLRGHKTY